jgi:hypothetical protein
MTRFNDLLFMFLAFGISTMLTCWMLVLHVY